MGLKVLLDTNAIIALLKNEGGIQALLNSYTAIYVSVISIIEFNAYPSISKSDIELFQLFLTRVQHIDLLHDDSNLLQQIIKIRKAQKIKLPDAIIVASAMILKADLMTADKEFTKIKGLTIANW